MSRQPNEAILDPQYWANRQSAATARGQEHHAIYLCPRAEWEAIELRHRAILAEHVKPGESILDAGCGWGRLLSLLPADWTGVYHGVDVSPEFLAEGERRYGVGSVGNRRITFSRVELVDIQVSEKFDWGVLISIKPMIVRNLGGAYWERCETALKLACSRLLFLEYDVNDSGEVLVC